MSHLFEKCNKIMPEIIGNAIHYMSASYTCKPIRAVSKGGVSGGVTPPQSSDTVGKTVSVGKMRKGKEGKGEKEKEEKKERRKKRRRKKKEKEGERRRERRKRKKKEKKGRNKKNAVKKENRSLKWAK